MTATIGADCANVTLVSEYFDADNISAVLTVKHNCDTEWELDIDVTDTEIVVDPTLLELDQDSLDEGIYYFLLTITQSDSTVIPDPVCVFVNCETTCSMLDVFKDLTTEENIVRALSFYALTLSEGCTSCECTDLCTLYNNSLDEDCEDVKPCGCS